MWQNCHSTNLQLITSFLAGPLWTPGSTPAIQGQTGLSLPFGPRAGSLLPLKTSPLLTEIGCPVNWQWMSQEALKTALTLGQECFCNGFSIICPSREPCGVIAASCSGFAISICFSHVIWWSIHSIFCKRRRSQLQEWKNEPKKTVPGQSLEETQLFTQEDNILYVVFFQTTKNSLYKLSPEYPVAWYIEMKRV